MIETFPDGEVILLPFVFVNPGRLWGGGTTRGRSQKDVGPHAISRGPEKPEPAGIGHVPKPPPLGELGPCRHCRQPGSHRPVGSAVGRLLSAFCRAISVGRLKSVFSSSEGFFWPSALEIHLPKFRGVLLPVNQFRALEISLLVLPGTCRYIGRVSTYFENLESMTLV